MEYYYFLIEKIYEGLTYLSMRVFSPMRSLIYRS